MSDLPPAPPVVPVWPPPSVIVDVNSAWWSKINWTQVVGFGCTVLAIVTGSRLSVPPDVQLAIVAAIQGIQALITIILKTYYTPTVTPNSLTPAIVLKSKGLRL